MKKIIKELRIVLINMFLIMTICACNNVTSQEEISCCEVNLESLVRDTIPFEKKFCDIKLIPLENNRNAMMSFVPKMIVTEDKYILLNMDVCSSVFLFGRKGEFQGQVGSIGHGHGEYEHVFDISVDSKEHIILSTFDKFMVFDSKGKFLNSKESLYDAYMKNILCYDNGVVCASNYSGSASLLHFFDKSFKLNREILPSHKNLFGNPPTLNNTLHIEGDILCYCNPYASEFNIIDLQNLQITKRYLLKSKNMLTIEKSKAEEQKDENTDEIDAINSFYMENGKIIANLFFHDERMFLEIDVETDSCTLTVQNGWYPEIYDKKDQFYYSILSQDELLDIINGKIQMTNEAKQMIHDAYENMGHVITERDNYIVMQMKKRINQ